MKGYNVYSKVHQMREAGFSQRAIAKSLGINRKTVKRYWDMDVEQYEHNARKIVRIRNLDTHRDQIVSWLREYPSLSAAQVCDWLKEHYEENHAERTVSRYVKELREEYRLPRHPNPRSYEAVAELPMGQQMQVDFGQTTLKNVDGTWTKVYVAVFLLSHSRYKYAQCQSRPFTAVDLVAACHNCFRYWGGMPREMVFDQDSIVCVSENSGDIIGKTITLVENGEETSYTLTTDHLNDMPMLKDRQCLLTFLKKADGTSYYTGDVDGIYGRLSRKAIQDFQKDFGGLTVTGEADLATDQAMLHAVAFGIPERDPVADPDVTDNNVGNKVDADNPYQHWWEEIEFFDPEEMKCKCKGKYCDGYPHEIQPLLMQILDRARRWSGHPIKVISGLRCEKWNSIQGGVANSQHKYGEAVDVYFYGVTPSAALAWLQSQPDVRYAYQISGCSNIHFDIHKVGR